MGKTYFQRPSIRVASSQKKVASSAAYARFSQDTDLDGLKDWEENLWETDPKNPDSDGDGTKDGDEVKAGRDPKKAGPDDRLTDSQLASADQKKKTLTQELAQNINIRYFTEKGLSDNQPLTSDQKNSIVAGFLNDIDDKTQAYGDAFSSKDLNIAPSESVRSYGNKLGGFLSTTFSNLSGYELDIADRASKSGNFALLKQLDPYIADYAKTIEFMKKQPVPPEMVTGHLILLNSVNNLKIADEKIKLLGTDGASAVVGLRVFGRETPRIIDFLRELRDQFNRNNVSYSASEPGAFFYKYFELHLKNN